MVYLIQSQVNITSTLHMYEGSCASCIVILRHIIVINPMEALMILSKSFHFTFEVGFELNTNDFAASTMGIYPHSAKSTLFKDPCRIIFLFPKILCLPKGPRDSI